MPDIESLGYDLNFPTALYEMASRNLLLHVPVWGFEVTCNEVGLGFRV